MNGSEALLGSISMISLQPLSKFGNLWYLARPGKEKRLVRGKGASLPGRIGPPAVPSRTRPVCPMSSTLAVAEQAQALRDALSKLSQ
jgi:hypothetical protein